MTDRRPVLSICLPTYNRCEYLEPTIKSIVEQKIFKETNDIELVVGDNVSTDATREVVERYQREFPDKIVYLRQEKSIHPSIHFIKVLEAGRGEFLKLNNDYLAYKEGGLEHLVEIIKENLERKDPIFLYHVDWELKVKKCETIDDFLRVDPLYNAWIGGFGFWREDFAQYGKYLVTLADTMIPQTYILLEMCVDKGLVVYHYDGFNPLSVNKKTGYNVAEVFGYRYLTFLKEFLKRGALSQKMFVEVKKTILKNLVNVYYFDLKDEFAYYKTGYFKWLWTDYRGEVYFWYWWVIFSCARVAYWVGIKVLGDRWWWFEKKLRKVFFN